MAGRWGVHPVLEPALAALGEDDVPVEVDRALPPGGSISTRGLVRVALVCVEHARPAARGADFERLAALVARQASSGASGREPWHADLAHVRRDFEHGRGATRIAARAAEVAWCDVMRAAPGAGAEATGIAADTVARTAALLRGDRSALVAFVLALAERVAGEQREYAVGAGR